MSMKTTRIGWFMRKPAWGTVYLMSPDNDPKLFKIGFTRRKTIDRRRELQRPEDGKLRIICTVSLPHALILEQRLLAKMRGGWRLFRRRPSDRGTEWFYLRRWETVEMIAEQIEYEARRLRLTAGLRFSWPWLCRIKVFRSTVPARRCPQEAKPSRLLFGVAR